MDKQNFLNQIENIYKRKKEKFRNALIIIVFLFPILTIALVERFNLTTNIGLFSIGFLYVYAMAITLTLPLLNARLSSNSEKQITKLYKEAFVPNELSSYFQEVSYTPDHGFYENNVWSFGISLMGNYFHSEDLLKGVYNDVHFEHADVTIKQNDAVHNTTYFSGRMYVFDFPAGATVSGVQIFSKIYQYIPPSPTGIDLPIYTTRDELFDRLFTVKSVAKEDADKLLTPQLLARIMALRERCNGLTMHFTKGKLYLGTLGVFDSFEPLTSKNFDYEYEQEHIRKNVQLIMDVIDTMTQNAVM